MDRINHAISLEDSSRADYALTIMSYQNHKLAMLIQKQRYEFTNELERLHGLITSFYGNNPIDIEKRMIDTKIKKN